MKILVIDHNALDPLHRSLYDHLAQLPDVTLRLILPDRWHDNYQWLNWKYQIAPLYYEILPSKMVWSSRTHRMIYLSLRGHLRGFEPDLVFINAEPEAFQTYHAAMLVRDKAKFVFSTWRNMDYTSIGFPYKLPFLNSLVERAVLHRADHAVAFHQTAKTILSAGGFSKVTVIPPFIDSAFFGSPLIKSRRRENSPFVIGYIGRFTPEKGVDILLRAVSRLPFDYKLHLIGTGPSLAVWTNLAHELGIAEKVVWIPPLLRSEVIKHLFEMDVVVLPSKTSQYWKEQFGRVLIESMASGVPVIGSTSGEIPAVIAEAGLLFEENDVAQLADRLQSVYSDEDQVICLVEKGFERVRTIFDVKVVMKKFYETFNSVLVS